MIGKSEKIQKKIRKNPKTTKFTPFMLEIAYRPPQFFGSERKHLPRDMDTYHKENWVKLTWRNEKFANLNGKNNFSK